MQDKRQDSIEPEETNEIKNPIETVSENHHNKAPSISLEDHSSIQYKYK